MDRISAQYGNFLHLYLEVRCLDKRWEWRVFDRKTKIQISQGAATSIEGARAAAEESAGGKPDWRDFGDDISFDPST
jgi:hypothetical protein